MDSVPDTGLYSDMIVDPSVTDPTFSSDLSTPTDTSSLLAGLPDPTSLSNLFTFGGTLKDILTSLTKDVGTIVLEAERNSPATWVRLLGAGIGQVGDTIGGIAHILNITPGQLSADNPDGAKAVAGAVWQFIASHSLGFLFRGMLDVGLEVDTGKFDADAQRGVNVIDTMLSFSFLLQFVGALTETFGKWEFGGRWGEALAKSIQEIPEELGLTWAMGMSIDEAFKTAVGRSIEEGINKQKRGERIGWPQLRTLLKQHVLDPDHFQELMENQGFPDEQIELLRKLQDVQIPIGDIAQLWYRDIIDDARAKSLINELGFGDEQTDWLFDLYVKKAENSASVTYRTIARGMFVNHLITEDMYRAVLVRANYPSRMIDEDIAGITLEQDVGHVLNAASTIKTRYQHGAIDAQEARKELRELNYADTYISQLIQTWDMKPLVRSHGLSQAKLLSYYVSGILSRAQARPQLIATGLDDASTDFLLDHPTANTGARQHARSPGLVTQAYLDGALQHDQLADAYKSAGVMDRDIAWNVDIAEYRYAHMKGHGVPHKTLSDGDIRAAFKGGLIDFQHCVAMLQMNGWSSDDAMLLTEITNKGPYQAPQPPAFATLGEALDYIQAAGYTLVQPMDPMLLAAENMAAVAGYSWQKSPDTVGSGIPGGSVPPVGTPVSGTRPPIIYPPPIPPA